MSSSLRTSTTQGSLRGEFGKLASNIEAEARSDSAELLATQLHPSWKVLCAPAGYSAQIAKSAAVIKEVLRAPAESLVRNK